MMNLALEVDRADRIAALRGKYVLVTDSRYDKNKSLYYCDPKWKKGESHWTLYLACAMGWSNEAEANAVCAKLRFGNPRVVKL